MEKSIKQRDEKKRTVLKLVLQQSRVRRVGDFIFLASGYEGIVQITPLPAHLPTYSVWCQCTHHG